MRYIKTFEKKKRKPEQFDYVVCLPGGIDFVEDNFGQIIHNELFVNPDGQMELFYYVEYKNVPEKLKENFENYYGADCFIVIEDEILYWSKNKEDVESYLATKKYNL